MLEIFFIHCKRNVTSFRLKIHYSEARFFEKEKIFRSVWWLDRWMTIAWRERISFWFFDAKKTLTKDFFSDDGIIS